MKKVYLGGSKYLNWREKLIPMLKIDYYDSAEETDVKKACDFLLFVLCPTHQDSLTVAHAVGHSIRRPQDTILCVLSDGGAPEKQQAYDIGEIEELVSKNGVCVYHDLQDVADYLNKSYVKIEYNPNVIQCLIERAGPTEMNIGKASYSFEKNALGHYTCNVLSQDHRKRLITLPDFRIYMAELAPKEIFTPVEKSFMNEWNFMDSDSYLAYVNGHIGEFIDAREHIREIAIGKWHKLLPKQECPIDGSGPKGLEVQPLSVEKWQNQLIEEAKGEDVSAVNHPETYELKESRTKLTAFEKRFCDNWANHTGKKFAKYVKDNSQKFLDLPPFMWNHAKAKWLRLVEAKTGEPWPFEESLPVEDTSNDSR